LLDKPIPVSELDAFYQSKLSKLDNILNDPNQSKIESIDLGQDNNLAANCMLPMKILLINSWMKLELLKLLDENQMRKILIDMINKVDIFKYYFIYKIFRDQT